MDSKDPPSLAEILARLRRPRVQLVLLAGVVAVIVLVIFLVDLATGGDTEAPASLGSGIDVTPGTRVVVVPTLAPVETSAAPMVATPTASTEADALIRDALRLQDLEALHAALAEYRERFGEYPDNEGSIQTMCAYKELDKGCDLKEVLDEDEEDILEDPLGEPLANGYWYASDGDSYTIWMLREGPGESGDPVCPEVIPHLRDKGSLFCITVTGDS